MFKKKKLLLPYNFNQNHCDSRLTNSDLKPWSIFQMFGICTQYLPPSVSCICNGVYFTSNMTDTELKKGVLVGANI